MAHDTVTQIAKDGKKILTNTVQDCDGTLAEVKRDRELMEGKKSEFGYKAARIPMVMLHKWGAEDYPENPLCYLQGLHNKIPELARKLSVRLNSNEYNAFRIWNGTVSSSDMLKEGNKFR